MTNVDSSSRAAVSTHRLPTISASQAFQKSISSEAKAVSVGLPTLDRLLSSRHDIHGHEARIVPAGLRRTQVAEIYGPPGAGKTTMSMQAAVSALGAGNHVVWIDCASKLPGDRLKQLVTAASPPLHDPDEALARFHHFYSPSLAHLLALTVHDTPSFPPSNTSLIVIESPASLLDLAYPRRLDDRSESSKWISSRRQAATGELSRALTRLAAVRNLTVIVTTHATTKLRGDAAAMLRPAIVNFDWENAVSHKIILFQDWAEDTRDDYTRLSKPTARFACLSKPVSQAFTMDPHHTGPVAFDIRMNGLSELPTVCRKQNTSQSGQSSGVKRAFSALEQDQTEQESGEEYGWIEDDDQLTAEGLVDESELISGLTDLDSNQTGPPGHVLGAT